MSLETRNPALLAPVLLFLLAAGLAPAAARAAAPERYAYLFLQGKVSVRTRGDSQAGVRILLTSPSGSFETTTDERGIFVFEKLPVASYDLRVVTPQGRGMRSVRPFADPRGVRLEIRTGRGEGKHLHLDATAADGRVAFDVPEHAPDWSRFWKEFAIVVGAAAVFAL